TCPGSVLTDRHACGFRSSRVSSTVGRGVSPVPRCMAMLGGSAPSMLVDARGGVRPRSLTTLRVALTGGQPAIGHTLRVSLALARCHLDRRRPLPREAL